MIIIQSLPLIHALKYDFHKDKGTTKNLISFLKSKFYLFTA